MDGPESINQIHLQGRVSGEPEVRTLPSGDELCAFRVVVDRPPAVVARRKGTSPVDTLDCVAWSATMRRRAGTWRHGDVVAVDGALRRRFYRGPSGALSRVEVEVVGGRIIRRAVT